MDNLPKIEQLNSSKPKERVIEDEEIGELKKIIEEIKFLPQYLMVKDRAYGREKAGELEEKIGLVNIRPFPRDFIGKKLATYQLSLCLEFINTYNQLFRSPKTYKDVFLYSSSSELSRIYESCISGLFLSMDIGCDAKTEKYVKSYIQEAGEKEVALLLKSCRCLLLFGDMPLSIEKAKEFFLKYESDFQTKIEKLGSKKLGSLLKVIAKYFSGDKYENILNQVKDYRENRYHYSPIIHFKEGKYAALKEQKADEKELHKIELGISGLKEKTGNLSIDNLPDLKERDFLSQDDIGKLANIATFSWSREDRKTCFTALEDLNDLTETSDNMRLNFPVLPGFKTYIGKAIDRETGETDKEYKQRLDDLKWGYERFQYEMYDSEWLMDNNTRKIKNLSIEAIAVFLADKDPGAFDNINPREEKIIFKILMSLLLAQDSLLAMDTVLQFLEKNKKFVVRFPEIKEYINSKEFELKFVGILVREKRSMEEKEFSQLDNEEQSKIEARYKRSKETFKLIIGRYGLDPDKLLKAWDTQSKISYLEEDPYSRNLYAIQILAERLKGAPKFLFEQFNIQHFSRYPLEILLSQCKEFKNAKDPYVLVLNPVSDYNGAFSQDYRRWQSLFEQLKRNKFLLRIAEADGKIEIARELTFLKKSYGQAYGAFIGGHGTAESIDFGGTKDVFDKDHRLKKRDLMMTNFRDSARNFFHDDSTIVLNSCATGAKGGIAEEFSKTGIKVIGPEAPASIRGILVIYDREAGSINFKIKYSSKDDKAINREYFAGREVAA